MGKSQTPLLLALILPTNIALENDRALPLRLVPNPSTSPSLKPSTIVEEADVHLQRELSLSLSMSHTSVPSPMPLPTSISPSSSPMPSGECSSTIGGIVTNENSTLFCTVEHPCWVEGEAAEISGCNTVICNGEFVCRHATISAYNEVKCQGYRACRDANSLSAPNVTCDGEDACRQTSEILAAEELLCTGSFSCRSVGTISANDVFCTDFFSCADVHNISATHDVSCIGSSACRSVRSVSARNVACAGFFGCYHADSVVAEEAIFCSSGLAVCNSADILAAPYIVCSSAQACENIDEILASVELQCLGRSSCDRSDIITPSLSCIGRNACQDTHIVANDMVLCQGENTCEGAFISGPETLMCYDDGNRFSDSATCQSNTQITDTECLICEGPLGCDGVEFKNLTFSSPRKYGCVTEEPTSTPSRQPSVVPTAAPTCPEGTFTSECLPLIYMTQVVPQAGPDTGNYVVRVEGYNMDGDEIQCRFGSNFVDGTFLSSREISCVAPSVVIGPEGEIVVDFSVHIDGEESLNSVSFTFFGDCKGNPCTNGFCSGGECFCFNGYTGGTIDVIVDPPVLADLPDMQVIVGNKVNITPVVLSGTPPFSWTVSSSPVAPGLTVDSETGEISWNTNLKGTVMLTVQAQNEVADNSVTFELLVLPVYYIANVDALVDKLETGPENRFVPIEGNCLYRSNNSAVSFCSAEVFVLNEAGFRRILSVTSDQEGKFRVPFVPYVDEGGVYEVGGQVPGFSSGVPSDSFTIFGLSVSPTRVIVSGYPDEIIQQVDAFTISTVKADFPLSGLSVNVVSDLPGEIQSLVIGLNGLSLDSATLSVTANVTLLATSPVTDVVHYEILSNSSAFAVGEIEIRVSIPVPELVATPSKVSIKVNQGGLASSTVLLRNEGAAPTGQLQVILPPGFDLLQISSGAVIASLSPGESFPVVFSSAADPDEPFDRSTGRLQIRSDSTFLDLRYEIQVTSSLTGNLTVVCEDEYTFFADGSPRLSEADVRIRNLVTGDRFRATTDATGEAVFSELAYGLYGIRASASNHDGFYQVLDLESPESVVYAFLARQLVSYSWTVRPTLIEEEYETTIEATFTTFVPAPVIVIDPVQIDITTLTAGVDQINFKITNHGLISVNNFDITLPSVNGLQFVPLLEGPIGDVLAGTTIFYPVKIEALPSSRALQNSGNSCTNGNAVWSVKCRKDEWRFEKITYITSRRVEGCRTYSSRPSQATGSSECCTNPGSIRGGPSLEIGCQCQLAIFGCLEKLLPLDDVTKCAINMGKCIFGLMDSQSGPFADATCAVKASIDCAMDLAGNKRGPSRGLLQGESSRRLALPAIVAGLTRLQSIVECADDLLKRCFDRPGGLLGQRLLNHITSSRELQDIELEDEIAARNFQDSTAAIVSLFEFALKPFGGADGDFFDSFSEDSLPLFQSRLADTVNESGDMGEIISHNEVEFIVATPFETAREQIVEFAARWNRSLAYYTQGYYSVTDLPPDLNQDMIDYSELVKEAEPLSGAISRAQLQGFTNLNSQWHSDADNVVAAASRSRDGVCAKVRVQIKQRAVLTREAFEAELQVENGGSEMSEIRIQVIIKEKGSDIESNQKFVIDDPVLLGITSVDGSGTLGASLSGIATWLFLPLGDAAPTEAVEYEVSGLFEYVNENVQNSINLLPDTITVSPDPQLELVYFHEYEIFADDPFTLEVEPSIPYKLAVLVKNEGFGDAINLKIVSAQPEITENDKGLLINFKIISARVGGKPAAPSLAIDFGTIPAQSTAVGIWELTSSLQGTFSNYSASFTYKGPINDDRLALVKSVDIFQLTHCVQINGAAATATGTTDDDLPDFLINKFPDIDRLPDTIVSSADGTEQPVFVSLGAEVLVSEAVRGESSMWRLVVRFTLPNIPDGVSSTNGNWYYYRFDDPLPKTYVLQSAIRSLSGESLPVGQNVWRTAKTKRFVETGPVDERFIHLVDFASPTGDYELTFRGGVDGGNLALEVSDVTDTSARITWAKLGETSFSTILQKFDSQPASSYVPIEVNLLATEYIVSNLSPGTAYSFQIQLFSEDGQVLSLDDISVATTGTPVNLCGNGVLDPGETCDDGNTNDGDCCSSFCEIESAGTICRRASGPCDLDDECDGLSPSCGLDVVLPFGSECEATTVDGCLTRCTGESVRCLQECPTDPPTPTERPDSVAPSATPSILPSDAPSSLPSPNPSLSESGSPTAEPTLTSSLKPSAWPSHDTSSIPSFHPSVSPSAASSGKPSSGPSPIWSGVPSSEPSPKQSSFPTSSLSDMPSVVQSLNPSSAPSSDPSSIPSGRPTIVPSVDSSWKPSSGPSPIWGGAPSLEPSLKASPFPTGRPSEVHSGAPSWGPSLTQSSEPSSFAPSVASSSEPSTGPAAEPSAIRSGAPSFEPSFRHSQSPTGGRKEEPSAKPSRRPLTGSGPTVQTPFISSGSLTEDPSVSLGRGQSLEPTSEPTTEPSLVRSGVGPTSEVSPAPSSDASSVHPRNGPAMIESLVPGAGPASSPDDKSVSDLTYEASSSPSPTPSSYPRSAPSSTGAGKGPECFTVVWIVVTGLSLGLY